MNCSKCGVAIILVEQGRWVNAFGRVRSRFCLANDRHPMWEHTPETTP